MRGLAALVLVAACNTPPLTIVYEISDGPTQSCPSTSCDEIPLACDAVLNIRILRPTEPETPYVSVCEAVNPNRNHDLCSIASIDLPDTDLPKETLEVQVIVWPRSAVEDSETGMLDCQKNPVTFSQADGFPLDQFPAPALGGHAYFTPGDEKTTVMLGCTDLAAVNDDSCVGVKRVDVKATVSDFDTHVSVGPAVADRLSVDIGEPREVEGAFVMTPTDVAPLGRTVPDPVPAWGAFVDKEFQKSACLQVLEDVPQATSSITCRDAKPTNETIDLEGGRMSKSTLQQLLGALSLPAFPDEGMTIGIVLDYQNNPLSGVTVQPDAGTIRYINANRTGVVVGPQVTSPSGIFVSQDAMYGTRFASSVQAQTVVGLGGRVEGKVTLVVLQFDQQIGN